MKCEDIIAKAQSGESGLVDEAERRLIAEHIAGCDECQDAVHGVKATQLMRNQPTMNPAKDLFGSVMASVAQQTENTGTHRQGFWLGAGTGAAVAATLFAAVVSLGLLRGPELRDNDPAEFYVSTSEPRELNIAIDAETALPGATVSLTFYGGIELAGYASQRHLSWSTDLEAGVNKLTLPIIALDDAGGQVIVRLDHPDSQQEFLVTMQTDG